MNGDPSKDDARKSPHLGDPMVKHRGEHGYENGQTHDGVYSTDRNP